MYQVLVVLLVTSVNGDRTVLEDFLPLFRSLRDESLNVFGRTSENFEKINLIKRLNKLQPQLNVSTVFPCPLNNTKSNSIPKSVDKLKPGDIDVIAAMGDSLTCGTGLLATNLFELFIENRGIAFSGGLLQLCSQIPNSISSRLGGQGNWRNFITLPNIIKEFNPSLRGYSTGDSFSHNRNVSNLNVCESGAMSRDMPYMAKFLVKRMQEDSKIDIKNHWKLITLSIGPNDFCSRLCYLSDPEEEIIKHKRDLRSTFRILRNSLPRTFVNLIVATDVTVLTKLSTRNSPAQCYYTHNIECSCLFGAKSQKYHKRIAKIVKLWQNAEIEVAYEKEFDKDDFTIVAQVFATGNQLPMTKEGFADFSHFSYDCFHLSQKMNAKVATSLWNNLLSPIGRKSIGLVKNVFDLKCPSSEHPYLYTRRN